MKITMIAILSLVLPTFASTALAQDEAASPSSHGRIGVGMFATLTSPNAALGGGGAALVFDARSFRLAGNLAVGIDDEGADALAVGARALFPVHSSTSADFSLGAGAVLGHVFLPGVDDNTYVVLEGLAQIRVFIADNVALVGTLGVGLALGEGQVLFGLGGQLSGAFGLTYFF